MPQILVNTKFDAGSIIVHDLSNPQNLRFGIRNDTNSHFAQWFYQFFFYFFNQSR